MFRLIPGNQLSEEHFEEYPVWSEYYDYEEFEEIISWGINRKWLEAELQNKHNGNEHCVYTLLQVNPFPDRMRIFIKASFQTVAGLKLTGYIVNEDAYCIHIFCNGKKYIFNNYPMQWDYNEEIRLELQKEIGTPEDPIFPFIYETAFIDSEKKIIQGIFQPEKSA